MALDNMAVFSRWVYTAQTEVLRQQVNLFNAASRGTIVLRTVETNTGDYTDEAFYAKVANGIVRRRNPYAATAIATKELSHLIKTSVKVAAGSYEMKIDPAWWNWIKRSPQEAGAVIGQQMAVDTFADMLNTALLAAVPALGQVSDVTVPFTGATATVQTFNTGQAKFGDAYQDIAAWVMHSKPLFDIYGAALENTNGLFEFSTVNVRQDGFGRVFIITDSPSLANAGASPDQYRILGLVPSAIVIEQNDDFDDVTVEATGNENIARTYQAEWSYNLGIKGFSWDKANGDHAPNDAALGTATNWDRIATSHKDLAGVLITTL